MRNPFIDPNMNKNGLNSPNKSPYRNKDLNRSATPPPNFSPNEK